MKKPYIVLLRILEFCIVAASLFVIGVFGIFNVFPGMPMQTASLVSPFNQQEDFVEPVISNESLPVALPVVNSTDGLVICKSDALALQYLSEKIDELEIVLSDVQRLQTDVEHPEDSLKEAPKKEMSVKKAAVVKAPKKVTTETATQQSNMSTSFNGGGGSGGGAVIPVYSKILISEITLGSTDGSMQEFVELYNPNEIAIDLTNWYLQRKTKTGESFLTFVPSTAFLGKTIEAHGYFLIARQDSIFVGAADIIADNPLTEDNALVLKNPNGEISDKVGFGTATEYEGALAENPGNGQSIGRKFIENQLQDTDTNANDFEITNLTPKAQNSVYSVSMAAQQQENNEVIEEQEIEQEEISEPEQLEEVAVEEEPVIEEIEEPGELVEQPEEVPITTTLQNIIIHQIQTTGQTAKDEFVRLYNPNAVDVDLAGFSLKKKTSTGTESNLVSSASFIGTIPALGYFVIAPQDNDDGTKNYTGSVVPDLRYSGSSFSIANTNTNTIILYDDTGLMQNMQVAPLL